MGTLSLFPQGSHNKKTSGFIRACMAYCYITIPSIMSPFTRYVTYVGHIPWAHTLVTYVGHIH